MIVVRAPLRITFVGDATDIKGFYSSYPGRVVSATIDKYIYLVLNPQPWSNRFIMKYKMTEDVAHPRELKHDRVKAALLDLGLTERGMEMGTFADIPGNSGLGSSSSFSVALYKGLYASLGRSMSKREAADAACRLEIDLLKEPIGKQDQYAAAFGGFNFIQFNPDESVAVEPILVDFKKRTNFEKKLMLFFTGMTRDAASVLDEQTKLIEKNYDKYKKMSDSAIVFRDLLEKDDCQGLADLINKEWEMKRTLASNVTTPTIDKLYDAAMSAGAMGGKLIGAGSGGCLLFVVDTEKQEAVRTTVNTLAAGLSLEGFKEIPVKFTQSGTDILYHNNDLSRIQ